MFCHIRSLTLLISYAGKSGHGNISQMENSGGTRKSSKVKFVSDLSHEFDGSMPEASVNNKGHSSDCHEPFLWFGPKGNGGRWLC